LVAVSERNLQRNESCVEFFRRFSIVILRRRGQQDHDETEACAYADNCKCDNHFFYISYQISGNDGGRPSSSILDYFHADIFHDANGHIVGSVPSEHDAN